MASVVDHLRNLAKTEAIKINNPETGDNTPETQANNEIVSGETKENRKIIAGHREA
jgi:hypothetical protein